jgi:beta-N-acetylhexosaminidase
MIGKYQDDVLGQFIMPRLEIQKFEEDDPYRSSIIGLIEKKFVVGFCVFGGTIESLPIILNELQGIAKKSGSLPLLMSCDCEWGLPMRLHSGGTEFPHLMALEKMGDQNGIFQVGQAIGVEMSALGLHWNFAPVADINSNPKNPIINIRAFSGDPETVSESAISFYKGLESAGIIATAKHFPGHGDTHIDSHNALPFINKSFEEFEALELIPFRKLCNSGIPAVMTGHIASPKLAKQFGASPNEMNLPATISPSLTKHILREYIGYEGVIISDSLEMHGLLNIISDPAEIAKRVFNAGTDVLLMPTDPTKAYNGLKMAFDEGHISFEAIDSSFKRINNLRKKYVDTNLPKINVKWLEHEKIARSSARNSLTLTGSIRKPFAPSSVVIAARGLESEKKQIEILSNTIMSEFPEINVNLITNNTISNSEWGSNPLIVLLYRPRGALTGDKNTQSMHGIIAAIISDLDERKINPAGVLSLGDPYLADEFQNLNPPFILRTFSDSIPSIHAALKLLKENS